MNEAIYTAASGALVQQLRFEVLTNNLANANTVGFKEDRTLFSTCLGSAAASGDPQVTEPVNTTNGLSGSALVSPNVGVVLEGVKTDYSAGPITFSGNSLDLALNGNGFFSVKSPTGTLYTRAGAFMLDEKGVLVTPEGYPVLGRGGEVKIGGGTVAIGADGTVQVDGNQVATLKIVEFPPETELKKIGSTLCAPVDQGAKEADAQSCEVLQGYTEQSNVDAVKSMTEMIEVLRAYEAYQKVIQSVDEVTGKLIDEVGTLS